VGTVRRAFFAYGGRLRAHGLTVGLVDQGRIKLEEIITHPVIFQLNSLPSAKRLYAVHLIDIIKPKEKRNDL